MTAVAQQILLPDARGFTPLIYACSNGAHETVSTLLNLIAPHGSWFNASLNFRDPKQGKCRDWDRLNSDHYFCENYLN